MNRGAGNGLLIIACLAAAGISTVAGAQALTPQTPRKWSYDVDKRGSRVARDNRLAKPDGSWREEIRQGNCLTIKERSATGEYRETRQCNPTSSR